MLVFEYASNGTLYEHLHYGDAGHLSCCRRLKIAIGIVRGLRYLHTDVQPPFTISELNSNAVYLTEDFSPKAMEYLQYPDKLSMLVDSELKNVKTDALLVICSVISLCVDPEPSKRPSMQILCAMLEEGIDISVGAILDESSLVWADLALSV